MIPTLTRALLKAHGPTLQALAAAVGAIGKHLPEADSTRLQGDLLLVTLRSREPAAVAALLAAADSLRGDGRTAEMTSWGPSLPRPGLGE